MHRPDNLSMRIRVVSLTLLCAMAASSTAWAQFNVSNPAPGEDYHVELAAMFWTPTPELSLQTGALAAIGETRVDFVREFGIEDKRFREFRVVAKAGRKHKIRFSYVPVEYIEETVLARTITFGNRTFLANVPANGNLKWEMYRFGYEYDIVARDRGFFGIIGELKYNKIAAGLSSPFGTEAAEATAPVPALGIIGRVYPARSFSVTAEFTGFKIPDRLTEEFDAKLYDFDVYGTINFGRYLGVQGGYRSIIAEYLVDEDAGNLRLKGIYWGGVVRF